MGERRRRMQASGNVRSAAASAIVEDYEQLMQAGRALHAQGRIQEAVGVFARASRVAPSRPESLHYLGLCCAALGSLDLALQMLSRAVALQPDGAEFRGAYGRALSTAGRLEDAARELSAAAALSPDDAQVRRDLGAVLVHLQRFAEAEHWYQEAAEKAPGRADLHVALAVLQYDRNALREAQANYRSALALDASVARSLQIGYVRLEEVDPVSAASAAGEVRTATPAWRLVRRASDASGTPALSDEALRAACAERELVILDDVLPDADGHRRQALALDFDETAGPRSVNFPGRQTGGQPCVPIMQRIAGALGRDLKWKSPDNGAFRLSPAESLARSDIHIDHDEHAGGPMLAALLYLTPQEYCRGGTSFWRHRKTGWTTRPSEAELRAHGYDSFGAFSRRWTPSDRIRPFAEITDQRSGDWEFLFEIPMRFNRLVIYRGDYFHSVSQVFGSTAQDSRLVQLFYFSSVPRLLTS